MINLPSDKDKIIIDKIKEIKGIKKVKELSNKEKDRIMELEKEAEDKVLMGMGKGDNQGVKKCIGEMENVYVFGTNREFKWPEGPNVIFKHSGEVIGKELDDKEETEELKEDEDVSIKGNLIIYKDKMKNLSSGSDEPPTVVFPAKNFKRLEEKDKIEKAIFASPCAPSDEYLKGLLGLDKSNQDLGTVIVGVKTSKK
ncbi:MAG: hypothetical protein BTN85_0902 [Candidatus Methanohalarchaeum thermophilum]|uniref:Uncharacterized protein n=1 Tax=Methanohalarchaeum thermophilum TaxID=1903181 RepID=A0A1Q6DVL2_METT1|nr:MAG: hypothetical protein BTN85_0902 [Candidatus Methanohalarchaeum thermophilum]